MRSGRSRQLFHDTRDGRSDEREVEAFAACLSWRTGRRGSRRSSRSARRAGPAGEGRRAARGRGRPRARGLGRRRPGRSLTCAPPVINFADVLVRRGLDPQMPELPHVLGNEIAGDLDGRRVIALPRAAGGYAERVEVDPDWVFDLPGGCVLRRGRVVSHHVPDGSDPAGASGRIERGNGRARARRLGRGRLGGDPARQAPRRNGDRDRGRRGEARVRPRARRRRDAAGTTRSTI